MAKLRVGAARSIYVLGFVLASVVAVEGLADRSPAEWVLGPAMGLAIWWIAAGIAIRMGVFPREFGRWVRSLMGLDRRKRG